MEHDIIFSYFVPFFALLPPAPKQLKKIKILKKKKKKKKKKFFKKKKKKKKKS